MVPRGDSAAETTSVLLTKHYGQYLANATGHSTTVRTWIHSGQLGRRLRISQTTWLSTSLESEQAWCPRKTLSLRTNCVKPSPLSTYTRHGRHHRRCRVGHFLHVSKEVPLTCLSVACSMENAVPCLQLPDNKATKMSTIRTSSEFLCP